MKIFIPAAGGKILHIRNFMEVPEVERVIISEADPWVYGNFVADASYLVPRFEDPGFFDSIKRMYEKDNFDFCVPIHDVSLYLFSKHRDVFEDYPFRIAINTKETIEIVADKLATYEFFLDNDIPTAKVYTVDDFLSLKEYAFPYYIKPRYIYIRGTKKQLYMKMEDHDDIEYALRKVRGSEREFVVQDFLDGTEINIDFFCNAKGEAISIVPLRRLGMGASRGITRGDIVFDNRYDPYIHRITKVLSLWGANNVQAYVDGDGNMKFTEINGRFSGSSVLVKEAGVNFFYYFAQLLLDREVEITDKPVPLKMNSWEKPFFFTEQKIRKV
jgi:carbamoyl-phosphate synthase large subunit